MEDASLQALRHLALAGFTTEESFAAHGLIPTWVRQSKDPAVCERYRLITPPPGIEAIRADVQDGQPVLVVFGWQDEVRAAAQSLAASELACLGDGSFEELPYVPAVVTLEGELAYLRATARREAEVAAAFRSRERLWNERPVHIKVAQTIEDGLYRALDGLSESALGSCLIVLLVVPVVLFGGLFGPPYWVVNAIYDRKPGEDTEPYPLWALVAAVAAWWAILPLLGRLLHVHKWRPESEHKPVPNADYRDAESRSDPDHTE